MSKLDKSPSFALSVTEYPDQASRATHTPARVPNESFELNLTPHGAASSAGNRAKEQSHTPIPALQNLRREQLMPGQDPRLETGHFDVDDQTRSYFGNRFRDVNQSAKVSSGKKL